MRLGGPLFADASDPERWIAALRQRGYSAAYCPIDNTATDEVIRAYAEAARKADIVLAEVGAWSNPLSADEASRRAALAHCQAQLALADRIGARCCVNIAGSRGAQWDGPHPDNLTEATFDLIVESVRAIIDAVKPTRAYYTLETMPWMYPDSPESYLRLIRAVDRRQFAVHLDPVNLICSPQLFYANGDLLRECFAKLGPYIQCCHAKDITLSGKLTVHLDETRPGLGALDYGVFLQELDKLDPDTPLLLEHLSTEEDYTQAAEYVRSVAQQVGVMIR
ncbi:MAG TPA: TIM barrel protein [Chthonomonadaceae bacterium]|nr:TIM barrel protein [Chthonomonadaceae bacterium]